MQVNPEDGPPEIYVTWSDPRMTDFENGCKIKHRLRSVIVVELEANVTSFALADGFLC